MSDSLSHPATLASIAMGCAGLLLLIQARMQSRLLRRRIASGAGTVVMDAATGLFSPAAAWQCIRAEANRATRLTRPLTVWVATADAQVPLDEHGRALAFDLPQGATGIRLDEQHLCVLSCVADVELQQQGTLAGLQWQQRTFEPGDHAADEAREFISEVTGHG